MKFEYKMVHIGTLFYSYNINEEELNKLGNEGWELVMSVPAIKHSKFKSGTFLIFKRAIK